MENTFVMIKPDGVAKKVFKNVMETFLENGLIIYNVHLMKLDEELVNEHYSHLVGRDFYPHLKEFMLSGYVISMNVYGKDAVKKVRDIIGATNPTKALPGTIRAIYGDKVDTTKNVIHASDSVENGKLEIERFNNYHAKYLKKLKKNG